MNKPLIFKIFLSALCFGVALYLLMTWYTESAYPDAWYPNVLIVVLIWWGVAFALPLKQGEKLTDIEISKWFFSSFYLGLWLVLALYLWGSILFSNYPVIIRIDPWYSERWLGVLGFLGIMGATGAFFFSSWGDWLSQKRIFQGISFFLMLGVGIILLLELLLRTDYVIHHRLGPYPRIIAPEYTEARQQYGSSDMTFALEKPADKLRVLFIGDSYTYGDGIFTRDRYANVFQGLAPDDVEVVVLARNGYSTLDELERWRLDGVTVQADIVVIGVVTNDPDMHNFPQASVLLDSYIQFSDYFPTSSLAYYIDAKNWLSKAAPSLETGLSYVEWENIIYTDADSQALWVETVQTFHDEIVASGAQAWAYILATPTYGEDREAIPLNSPKYDRLEEVFREAGFQTYNLYPDIVRDFDPEYPLQYCAFPNDCHPSADIHEYYAQKMWADLEPVLESLRAD